jgi:hypothetical protein
LPITTWERDNHSVRTADWRFTRYRDGSSELYDHRSDPQERVNLAGDPKVADVCRELGDVIAALQTA